MNTTDNWVLALLARTGVDIEQLGRQLPDEMNRFVTSDPADVSVDAALSLFIAGAEQIGDPDLGLHLAEHMDFKRVGLYGYLLLNARTLGEFMELASHYFNILFHTSKIYFRQGPRQSRFEYRYVTPTTQPQRHDIDWSIGTYICAIRGFIGESWYPSAVHLSYAAPLELNEVQRFYGEQLFFGQQANYFLIDNELLPIRISDSDPELLKIIKDQADKLIHGWIEEDSFYHQVRLLIMQGMGEEGFNADVLARRMAMSISTLKRRLAEQKLSYRMIREELIDNLAKQMLKDTSMQIGHIASELGYSEPAAFDRAFKRLVGMTPREYRKRSKVIA
jgi:AraC-like DNA-binding protein